MRFENRKGSDHHNAKFSPEEAAAVCKRFAKEQPRTTIRQLARDLDVSRTTIERLVHKKSYQK